MENVKLEKSIVKKGEKTFTNFYIVIDNNIKIAVKPAFDNDWHVMNKLATFVPKKEKGE